MWPACYRAVDLYEPIYGSLDREFDETWKTTYRELPSLRTTLSKTEYNAMVDIIGKICKTRAKAPPFSIGGGISAFFGRQQEEKAPQASTRNDAAARNQTEPRVDVEKAINAIENIKYYFFGDLPSQRMSPQEKAAVELMTSLDGANGVGDNRVGIDDSNTYLAVYGTKDPEDGTKDPEDETKPKPREGYLIHLETRNVFSWIWDERTNAYQFQLARQVRTTTVTYVLGHSIPMTHDELVELVSNLDLTPQRRTYASLLAALKKMNKIDQSEVMLPTAFKWNTPLPGKHDDADMDIDKFIKTLDTNPIDKTRLADSAYAEVSDGGYFHGPLRTADDTSPFKKNRNAGEDYNHRLSPLDA